jgi:hypothetical protein
MPPSRSNSALGDSAVRRAGSVRLPLQCLMGMVDHPGAQYLLSFAANGRSLLFSQILH